MCQDPCQPPLEGVTASPAGVPWMSTVKLCRGFALRCAVPGCSRGPYPPVGDKREVRLPLTSLHRPPLAAEPNPQEQSLSLRLPTPVGSDPSLQVAALPQDHAKCTQAVVQVPTEPPQDGEDRETPWGTHAIFVFCRRPRPTTCYNYLPANHCVLLLTFCFFFQRP